MKESWVEGGAEVYYECETVGLETAEGIYPDIVSILSGRIRTMDIDSLVGRESYVTM